MKVFDEKYIYWKGVEQSLVGKEVLRMDCYTQLEDFENDYEHSYAHVLETKIKIIEVQKTRTYPYIAKESIAKLVYYDPLLEYKMAYKLGKTVYRRPPMATLWETMTESIPWEEGFEYHIESPCTSKENESKSELAEEQLEEIKKEQASNYIKGLDPIDFASFFNDTFSTTLEQEHFLYVLSKYIEDYCDINDDSLTDLMKYIFNNKLSNEEQAKVIKLALDYLITNLI